ncbi:MAG: tryptophan-rich sensory protein [Candidatus Moranbacteria bacterium]|nr:tryptophan-rich sensory protein [Candidatus Moranbacteria bacterium]
MNQFSWYSSLAKPSWAPPAWLFGPAWTILYVLIAISFGGAARLFFSGKIPFIVLLPFLLNLVFNFAFSPIQFGLRNNVLAAADCVLILVTLIWAIFAIWPHARWIAYTNIPYLLWVLFATTLQLTLTAMNR